VITQGSRMLNACREQQRSLSIIRVASSSMQATSQKPSHLGIENKQL
jgi:hypothetical protein